MKSKNNEAFEVLNALYRNVHFIGSDAGYNFWNNLITYLRTKEETPKDIDFVKSHTLEWPLINSERPDVIYEDDDNIVGIEYFIFDSSRSNRKGSSLLRSQKQLEDDLLSHYYATGETYLVANNETELQYNDYVKSAVNSFQKHARNIADYKHNLAAQAPGKTITLAFFIDDITILGNYAITERGKEEPLRILCVKQFLDALSAYPDLDYIISRGQVKYFYKETTIMEVTPAVLAEQYKEIYDDSKIVFLSEKSAIVQSIGGGPEEAESH